MDSVVKITFGVIALIIAAMPRDARTAAAAIAAAAGNSSSGGVRSSSSSSKGGRDTSADTVPNRYVPDQLGAYFGQRPASVIQRNVVSVWAGRGGRGVACDLGGVWRVTWVGGMAAHGYGRELIDTV